MAWVISAELRFKKVLGESWLSDRVFLSCSTLSDTVFLSCSTLVAPVIVHWCVSDMKDTLGGGKLGMAWAEPLIPFSTKIWNRLSWLTSVVLRHFTNMGKYNYQHFVDRGWADRWNEVWLGLTVEVFLCTQTFHVCMHHFPFNKQLII